MKMKDILGRILNQEKLQREETREILLAITKGEIPDEQISSLCRAIQMRVLTFYELLCVRDRKLET